MAVAHFIPEIWSGKLNTVLRKSLVFAGVCARQFEGDIKALGDTVHVLDVGAITIGAYPASGAISTELLSDAQAALVINQKNYFSFYVDDVDKAQARPELVGRAMERAALGLADEADQYIAGLYAGAGITDNLGTSGTPLEVSAAGGSGEVAIEDLLLLIGESMSDAKCPREGRFIILPPVLISKLLKSSIARATKNDEILVGGSVGRYLGFDVFESQNVVNTTGTKYMVLAGVRGVSIAYADQLVSTEAIRDSNRIADQVRGIHLFGAKVIRPESLACAVCNVAAG